MIRVNKTIFAVLAASALVGVVCADMMPTAHLDEPCQPPTFPIHRHRAAFTDQPAWNTSALLHPDFALATAPGEQLVHVASAEETVHSLELLTSDQGSVDLCLYALLGLGLCRSSRLVRKPCLGPLPEWYHSGGFYQNSDNWANGRVLSLYLTQPGAVTDDTPPRYRSETILALWRESHFTTTALASRGSPSPALAKSA